MFMKALSSRVSWVALAVLAVAALTIGSHHPPASSQSARISQLDSLIKCPGCEDLSISESQAPSSVTLRGEVAGWVRAGWSNQRIEQAVVSRYGPAGLLLPETTGSVPFLYLIPIGLIGLAVVALGMFLWRRQRALREVPT